MHPYHNALHRQFEVTGLAGSLDRAIKTMEHAIEATSADHLNRTMHYTNLGRALQCRFTRTGSIDDLDYMIKASDQALEIAPADHSSLAMCLNNFGTALRSLAKCGAIVVFNVSDIRSDAFLITANNI